MVHGAGAMMGLRGGTKSKISDSPHEWRHDSLTLVRYVPYDITQDMPELHTYVLDFLDTLKTFPIRFGARPSLLLAH